MKWPTGRRQNRKQAEPEFFPLSDVGLVKGEILALQYQKLTFNHKDAELLSCVTVLKI